MLRLIVHDIAPCSLKGAARGDESVHQRRQKDPVEDPESRDLARRGLPLESRFRGRIDQRPQRLVPELRVPGRLELPHHVQDPVGREGALARQLDDQRPGSGPAQPDRPEALMQALEPVSVGRTEVERPLDLSRGVNGR